jgi:hypothetical protein
MGILLILSAVGVAIIALRIFFALKTAHADDPQREKASREENTVPTSTGAPLSSADARGGAGIAVAVPPPVATVAKREKVERKEMWVDSHYCWVVLCKTTPPFPRRPLRVQCDDCHREYLYKPSDVLKYEQELRDTFTPHPLFRDC